MSTPAGLTDKCQQPYRGQSNMRSYWKLGGILGGMGQNDWNLILQRFKRSGGLPPVRARVPGERTGDLGRGMEEADQGPFAFDGEWVFFSAQVHWDEGRDAVSVRAEQGPGQSSRWPTDTRYQKNKKTINRGSKSPFPLGPDIVSSKCGSISISDIFILYQQVIGYHTETSSPPGRRMFHWWISPSSYTQVILRTSAGRGLFC